MRLNFKFLILLAVLVQFAFALTFPLITNVNARVNITGGSAPITVNTVGGVAQNITLAGVSLQTNLQVSAVSQNSRFNDFNGTMTLNQIVIPFSPWENRAYSGAVFHRVSHNGRNWISTVAGWVPQTSVPGQSPANTWEASWREARIDELEFGAMSINLPFGTLPADSVFIPVFSLVDVELEISHNGVPTATIQIPRRTLDTLAISLGGTVSIGQNQTRRNAAPARFVSRHGQHSLALSSNDFRNSEVRIVSVNGRVISSQRLGEVNQANINASNIAAGVYFLNARGANGANFTQRFIHNGGDLRVSVQLSGGGVFNTGETPATRSDRAEICRQARSQAAFTFRFRHRGEHRSQITDTVVQVSARSGEVSERVFVSLLGAQLADIFTKQEYENMFPFRFGFGRGFCTHHVGMQATRACIDNPSTPPHPKDGNYDFYSYDAFLAAISLMGEVYVRKEYARRHDGTIPEAGYRLTWTNRRTQETRTIQTIAFDFYHDDRTSPNFNQTADLGILDYSDFVNAGSFNDRRTELAAFFANVAQETGGAERGIGNYLWGLFELEEIDYHATSAGYRTEFLGPNIPGRGPTFPASTRVPTASYHGRGPLQLTHPVNYGQFSMFFFADQNILLDNPELLLTYRREGMEAGAMAFASAIWFWMTPQGLRHAPHQLYRSDFQATQRDIDQGRARPDGTPVSRFGWTIATINGGLECAGAWRAGNTGTLPGCPANSSMCDYRVRNRIDHFREFSRILGLPVPPVSELHCDNMNYR
ncbi:MAG: T9SS type A sorting domain-containing protein [Chitinivibrionia bacterium]|nr:T9SS type A sorting domain-containing protein [Chitinivibrionia bacterium]